jgi:hypothetical protein
MAMVVVMIAAPVVAAAPATVVVTALATTPVVIRARGRAEGPGQCNGHQRQPCRAPDRRRSRRCRLRVGRHRDLL